jgi:hypothetical protein
MLLQHVARLQRRSAFSSGGGVRPFFLIPSKLGSDGLWTWGAAMSRAKSYHRQADLCMRMALSLIANEERIRLLEAANEYRCKAAQAEGGTSRASGATAR